MSARRRGWAVRFGLAAICASTPVVLLGTTSSEATTSLCLSALNIQVLCPSSGPAAASPTPTPTPLLPVATPALPPLPAGTTTTTTTPAPNTGSSSAGSRTGGGSGGASASTPAAQAATGGGVAPPLAQPAPLDLPPPTLLPALGTASGLTFGTAPFLWPALLIANVLALGLAVYVIRRTWMRAPD